MALKNVFGDLNLEATQQDVLAAIQTLNPLTDAQLRGSPIEVHSNLRVNQSDVGLANPVPVTGNIAVSGPVTDAELRASPVDVDTGLIQPLTDTQLRASDVNVADTGEREYTHVVATVTSAGDTVLHTPAAGKSIRVRKIIAINDPTALTSPLIKVILGSQEFYRVWALSTRQRFTGPVDGPLKINLSGVGNVAVTVLLEEV